MINNWIFYFIVDNKISMELVIKELMDVFKCEYKDEIEKYLKEDLLNFDDLNEYVKWWFKGELLLYIVLKFNNINIFVKIVIKKNCLFLME